MRPAQLRRFAQTETKEGDGKKYCFNEAGAAAPVCPWIICVVAAHLVASMRPAQLRRFAARRGQHQSTAVPASMRPAQLRRFATSIDAKNCRSCSELQ